MSTAPVVRVSHVSDGIMAVSDTAGSVFVTPPDTFYLAFRGSHAHGLYIPPEDPNSVDDIDLMGFVFGDIENYLGFREWGSRGTHDKMYGRFDVVLYEIRKAFSLLLQGNPNILSMLWMDQTDCLIFTPAAKDLLLRRDLFVGKHVYNAFAGYAHSQLAKMESRDPAELRLYLAVVEELKFRELNRETEPDRSSGEGRDVVNWSTEKLRASMRSYQKKGENLGYLGDKRKRLVLQHGYDTKNAAHLIRLLKMCIEFMKTGELVVRRAADRETLLDIKTGKWSLEDVKSLAQTLFELAKDARDNSKLPDAPDKDRAERLLVRLLSKHLSNQFV